MIGFGNPLLDGDPIEALCDPRAQLARDKQRCPETALQRVGVASRHAPRRDAACRRAAALRM